MSKLITELGDYEFYVDRLIIYSKKEKKQLASWLPLRILNEISKKTHLRDYEYRKGGYKSVLDSVFINDHWFDILINSINEKGKKNFGEYSISHLELSYEWYVESHEIGLQYVEFIAKRIRKKHSKNTAPIMVKRGIQDGHKYLFCACEPENSKSNIVIYNRNSKKNNKPIIKIEWRLKSAEVIRLKTGICGINDLADFNYDGFFENNFYLESINYTAIADFLNINNKPGNKVGGLNNINIDEWFCRLYLFYGMNLFSRENVGYCSLDLRNSIKKIKKELINNNNKNNIEKMIESIYPYQVDELFNKE
jgi:hypothetical protein